MNKPEVIVIHHTGNNNGFEIDNDYHRKKWLKQFGTEFKSELGYSIGYQWYYEKKEKIWIQGRNESEVGGHTLGDWNKKSIGVALVGNYNAELFEFGQQLEDKIKDIRSRWGNLPIKTHGELYSTSCPGNNLQAWVDEFRKKEKQIGLLQTLVSLYQKLIELLTKGRN